MTQRSDQQTDDVTVQDNPEQQRYEVHVDGELAGFVDYTLDGQTIDLTHTEVDEAFSGRGLAKELAAHALEDARRRGLEVLPHCEFVAKYVNKHREFSDLVPAARRAEFGLA